MPARCMPMVFRPTSSARLPATVQYGATSMATPVMPPTKASRPTRQNWCEAERPPKCTWSSITTWPAMATEFAMMAPSPTWLSCPTWLFAMNRHPEPIRVTPPPPAVPRLTVTNSRKVFRSPIYEGGGLAAVLEVLGDAAHAAWGKNRLPAPKRGPAEDDRVRADHVVRPERHLRADHREGADLAAWGRPRRRPRGRRWGGWPSGAPSYGPARDPRASPCNPPRRRPRRRPGRRRTASTPRPCAWSPRPRARAGRPAPPAAGSAPRRCP